MKLAESKDIKQALELQSQHAKQQMEAFAQQLEAMRDLAAKLGQQLHPAGRLELVVTSPTPGWGCSP